jgi:hypothetical protein
VCVSLFLLILMLSLADTAAAAAHTHRQTLGNDFFFLAVFEEDIKNSK